MLSLRSGIFAGSLLGSGSCLQRLAPCACRSSRKPSPRKSPKKPFELQRDNISGEQRRLLALTEMGCRCPPRSPKERWFFTNQRIILALAIALDRPPDLVSEFLHSLTLQNFARIIKPPDSVGVSCKVPYVNCYACDNFMRIFDIHGNLRSRYNKDSLKMLLRLVQAVLRQDSQREPREPLDTSFGAQRGALAGDSIAKRAGIDRDSIARQNGKRRIRNSEARAAINRTDFSIGQVEPTIGDPGYVFGSSLDFSDWDDPMYTPEDWLFDDSLTSQRFKRLENLLIQLNEKTYLTRDSDHLITAIRDLNLGRTVTNPPQYSNDKVIVKKISDSYYERVKASASRTLFKKRSTHHIRKRKKSPEEDSMHKVHTDKLYYGAPVPVLMHEPFDREKPWTWLRRHPHQKRMDDTGRVTEGSIHRYRRSTIEQLMQKARERSSVSTVISMDSDRETKSNTQTKFGKKHTRR